MPAIIRGFGIIAGVLVAGGGCAQLAFSPSFPDNQVEAVRDVTARLKPRTEARPQNATGHALAFVVTATKPSRLIAYDLAAGKTLWDVEADVTSRIAVGRDFIYHRAGASELLGRRVNDGGVAWRAALPGKERLLGVATDDDELYYATEAVGRAGGTASRLVALDGKQGTKRWERESTGRIGAPTARDGLVLLPLRSQSIAVLDGAKGEEIARVRSKDEALLWVRANAGGVMFGGKGGIYRLDSKAVSGTQQGSTFLRAELPPSVRPVYWWDGYNAALAGYTAYDRNRLLWRTTGTEALRFVDDRIFIHNYRFVFAFGAGKDGKSQLRWAYSYPRHDAVASTFTGSSLLLLTDDGHLVMLDPDTGLPVVQRDLKLPAVRGATFDAAGYAPQGKPQGNADLRQTLMEVIWDPDRRFSAVKIFAVEELGKLTGPKITGDLVKIVTGAKLERSVYQRAGDVIVERKDKGAIPLYLRTLKGRYDFVEGSEPRAVDIMARALGDLKAPEAVQPLLAHLADHETPLPAVVEIVKSLVAIGDKSVVEPFRDFLLTYRCDPSFGAQQAQNVLNMTAEALLKMGGEDERQLLVFVENDVHTLAPLRVYIGKALREAAGAGAGEPGSKPPQARKGQ